MQITKRGELIAVHRAIMALNKHVLAADTEAIGSPYLASVAERVLHDLLKSNVEVDGGSFDEEMARWLRMADQPWVREIFVNQIQSVCNWLRMAMDDRRKFITHMASPVILPNGMLEELLVFGNNYHTSRTKIVGTTDA